MNFDYGSLGQRPLEIMPRLMIYNSGYFNLDFVTTKARKGNIKIAGQRYNVLLGHKGLVSGWFDSPWTALHLIPKDRLNQQARWGGAWGEANRLMAIHNIGGTLYRFSATQAGDKLTVKPYQSHFGTFKAGSSGRDINDIACSGSLCSEDMAVAVGGELRNGWPQLSNSSQIPVGDYFPASLTIQFDDMTVSISDNYHSDGEPMSRIFSSRNYGIKIREDKPFVFDFSNEPEIMFALPAKACRNRLGEQLTVKAILTDPKLDIMIRHLDRMMDTYGPDGKKRSYQKRTSLDPNVVITRADGEKIAEGVMPFG